MCVNQRVISEQAEARADVLLHELAFIVDFISCERRFSECRRTRARPADYRAVRVCIPDRFFEWRAAECRNELHLIAPAQKDSASVPNLLDDCRIARMVARFDQRNRQISGTGCLEIGEPGVAREPHLTGSRGETDNRGARLRFRELDERSDGLTRGRRAPADQYESSRGITQTSPRSAAVGAGFGSAANQRLPRVLPGATRLLCLLGSQLQARVQGSEARLQ